MFDAVTVAVSVSGGALIGGGVMLAYIKVRELRQRLHALEAKVNAPSSKHDMEHLVRHDVGEATLFDLAHVRTQLELTQTWLEQATRRAEFVAQGGKPDDFGARSKK